MNKKLCPSKARTFLHLKQNFQKITMKIDIVGTYPNFQLSSLGTMVV
jgi:hypothetical protein